MSETRTVPVGVLAGTIVTYQGERWTLTGPAAGEVTLATIPSELRVRVEQDPEPDWSWFFPAGHPAHDDQARWGPWGPIDEDGHEHVALGVVVERVYADGVVESVASMWGIDVLANDPTLVVLDGTYPVAEALAWTDDYDGEGRGHLGLLVADLVEDVMFP
jgi:hypothetical protein